MESKGGKVNGEKILYPASRPANAPSAVAGISLGKDLKNFAKMGWKMVVITLLVITGTFIFSALVADLVLRATGAI